MRYESAADTNVEDHASETLKFVFIAAIFVVTFATSLLPLRIVSNLRNAIDLDRREKYNRIVSVLNCFGGGVFLGTALLDLLPTVLSLTKQAIPNSTFPFAEFIIAFGFLTLLATEQIIIDCKERASDRRNPIERLQARNVQLERETLTVTNEEGRLHDSAPSPQPDENHQNSDSAFHSLFLVAALSVHSLFEGLAIGVLQSDDIVLWIFIGIVVHKIPVAFSLGLRLIQCELKISAVIQLNLWFSLMSPLGAGIGILLEILDTPVQLVLLNGVLVGLATGTFLFVIFLEILPNELKQGRGRLLNLLFLIFGFSFVCAAIFMESDKHHQLTSR